MEDLQLLDLNSLYELKSVAAPTMNDKGTVVYVQTQMRQAENDYISDLYAYNIYTKATAQWTFAQKGANYHPLWSPDGQKLAFLSSRTGKAQLYLFNELGGEPQKLTDLPQGVDSFIWDETGSTIYFNARVKDQGKEDDIFAYGPDSDGLQPLVIDNLLYRYDTVGYIDPHAHLQIFSLDVAPTQVEQLTTAPADHKLTSVYTNALLFSRDVVIGNDRDFNKKVYLLNIDTKETVDLVLPFESCVLSSAYFAPNGRQIAIIGHETIHGTHNPTIYLYDVKTEKIKDIWGHTDKFVGDCAVSDFKQKATTAPLVWAEDGKSIYFQASHDGMVLLYQLFLDGKSKIIDQSGHVLDFAIHGKHLVTSISTPNTPNNIYLHHLQRPGKQQISFANDAYLANKSLSNYQSLTVRTDEGYNVHAFLVLPANFDKNKQYPLILNVHGGPHAMYGATFFHEAQLMSAKGYAVLMPNPSGSRGYGFAHTDRIRTRYGEVDYNDIMLTVDLAIAKSPWINTNQLHVMGGSYGGYMTNWIVTQTHRFRSAATQRSVSNYVSIIGTSDTGYFADDHELENTIFSFAERWAISPMAYVKNIETPLLIMHSEEDYRCPIEQAEQLYVYLKMQGKTTRFMRFPKSSHELSRSGYPSLRIKRLEAIFDWFETY